MRDRVSEFIRYNIIIHANKNLYSMHKQITKYISDRKEMGPTDACKTLVDEPS